MLGKNANKLHTSRTSRIMSTVTKYDNEREKYVHIMRVYLLILV